MWKVMEAVDTCVLLNQWALAVELAQQHNLQSRRAAAGRAELLAKKKAH